MVKILVFIFSFIALLVSGWYLSFYIYNIKNGLAESQIKSLIPLIEDYKIKNDIYPESINNLPQYEKITDQKILLLLSASRLNYHVITNGYRLDFYGAPLGPHYGYDSTTKEWYSEE